MPFNPAHDKKLRNWSFTETGLQISISKYREGNPKLQIGPRFVLKKDKTTSLCRAGRLTLVETKWLSSMMEEIIQELEFLKKELGIEE